jgi:hypothetical protein
MLKVDAGAARDVKRIRRRTVPAQDAAHPSRYGERYCQSQSLQTICGAPMAET